MLKNADNELKLTINMENCGDIIPMKEFEQMEEIVKSDSQKHTQPPKKSKSFWDALCSFFD